MKKLISITLLVFFLFQSGFAQSKFSAGLMGTLFGNTNVNNKLTKAKNPLGYGLIIDYALNENVNVALTGEYFKNDIEGITGKEIDFRTNLSVYITPIIFDSIRPYFSAGVVNTYRKFDYNGSISDETKNIFNSRIGAGINYYLNKYVDLNLDLGLYNDGLYFVGWSSSVGFRYVLSH